MLKSLVKEGMVEQMESIRQLMEKENTERRAKRDKALFKDIVHKGITCDKCNMCPIIGIRYKSATKDNFDLCIDCEAQFGQDDIFLKIKRPEDFQKFLVELKRNGNEIELLIDEDELKEEAKRPEEIKKPEDIKKPDEKPFADEE